MTGKEKALKIRLRPGKSRAQTRLISAGHLFCLSGDLPTPLREDEKGRPGMRLECR